MCLDINGNELKDGDFLQLIRAAENLENGWCCNWNERNNENIGKIVKINRIIFLPDWDKYGKSAGFIRNKLIINEADMVVAFWDGKSKGTKNSIDLAINAGKPVDIYIRS